MLRIPGQSVASRQFLWIPMLDKTGVRPTGCTHKNLSGHTSTKSGRGTKANVISDLAGVRRGNWLRGLDLNQRPSGYEPDELPGCSTPRDENTWDINPLQIKNRPTWMKRICFLLYNDFVKAVSGRILAGTASWSDPGFVERWYPKKLPAGERLSWYAQHFDVVEVNSTFYSVPEPRMVERWCAATPDDFTFDVKLHQLFSFHATPAKLLPLDLQNRAETDAKGNVKATRGMEEALLKAFLRATALFRRAGKMGVLLLQLSPAFSPRKHELSELKPLIEILNGYELAIEFRNRNWVIGDQLESTINFVR